MIVILARLQHNAHRNALHNFYIVAAGILRRQQAEARTGGAAEGIDAAAIVAPGSVGAEGHALAGLHLLQLCFFEIGGDPDVVDGNDGQQLLARLHALAGFHGLAPDDPAYRRDDLCIAKVELRRSKLRPGARGF